jgi:hypothetical protein
MNATEKVFVRGPGVVARAMLWFLRFCRSLWLRGTPTERRRLIRHWALLLPTLLIFIAAPIITWRHLDPANRLGLFVMFALPLFAIYATLLDIVRRIRPLNEGKFAGATVLECRTTRGLVAIRVKAGNALHDCQVPSFALARQLSRGDWVVIAIHPLDRRIAAVVNATPQALFAEKRRRDCADFILQLTPNSSGRPPAG